MEPSIPVLTIPAIQVPKLSPNNAQMPGTKDTSVLPPGHFILVVPGGGRRAMGEHSMHPLIRSAAP